MKGKDGVLFCLEKLMLDCEMKGECLNLSECDRMFEDEGKA